MKNNIRKIINRVRTEDASSKNRQDFLALFHDEQAEYQLKEVFFNDLNEYNDEKANTQFLNKVFDKIWKEINRNNTQSGSKTKFLYPLLRIAAILIIGFIAGISISYLSDEAEPIFYSAFSPCGSVSKTILPDGSTIYLNAGSDIKYSINGNEGKREVFLNGEAWFDVKKNPEKPFVVHTPFYEVNVTGTQFNIKSYNKDDEIVTTLEEGQIIISPVGNYKFGEEVILAPGEQAILSKKTKSMAIKRVNTQWYTSWKNNKLIFVNTSLKELIVLLERKYGVDIEVMDNSILDYHYDGTIKNESIFEILEIIQKTLPIKFKIVGQKIEINAN